MNKQILEEKKTGLSLVDLEQNPMLTLIHIESMKVIKKNDNEIVMLSLYHNDEEPYQLGILGKDLAEEVLQKHGEKDNDGSFLLNVPAEKLVKKGAGWINSLY
tara:strand:+ start:358 stop:666 length:309 start_codon:yes stop_codon:yes gene_type:complete